MRPVDPEDFQLNKIRKETVATAVKAPQANSTVRITDETVQYCLDYYVRRYEKPYGSKPLFLRYNEEKTTMKDILRAAQGDKTLVLHMIDAYLGDTRKYFVERKHPLSALKENVQQLAAAVSLANRKAATPLIRISADTRCSGCGDVMNVQCSDPKILEVLYCSKQECRQLKAARGG